jgi:hypothetical protein
VGRGAPDGGHLGGPLRPIRPGIQQVTAAYLPDPRGGTSRWLHLGGMAHAPIPFRIAYRVTVQRRDAAS